MVEEVKKKRGGLRLVSRKSTQKMLGKWRKLDSVDKSDTEIQDKDSEPSQHILGLSLNAAINLDPSLDGLPLPAFFRTALDYVELNGLTMEGIYRVSSPKSRLDELERKSNKGEQLHFLDAHEAAGLIKRTVQK
uniref:Rho-GAP domain-containing protein n=1 Tax=Heterorhabditis bacteriophora TaxID=37862 RepID=A0A1I7WS32_HETBA